MTAWAVKWLVKDSPRIKYFQFKEEAEEFCIKLEQAMILLEYDNRERPLPIPIAVY